MHSEAGPQDRPDLDDLLATVGDFLVEAKDLLDGEARYHAIVCAYLVGICRRELDARGVGAPEPHERRRWCAEVRAGSWDDRLDVALDRALADVVAKVGVVAPDHLAAEHRLSGGTP